MPGTRSSAARIARAITLALLSIQALLLLLPVDPRAATSEVDLPATATESVISLQFELLDDRVVLPLQFGTSSRLNIILDTGMRSTGVYLFRKELSIHLDPVRQIKVRVGGAGSGEASYALMEDSTTLEIGGHAFAGQMVIVSQSDITQKFQTDGVMGYTFFGNYAVEIDYDELVIHLHDCDSFFPDTSWYAQPLVLQREIPFLDTRISIADEDPVAVRTYIDLAAREPLELLVKPDMKFTLPENLTEEIYLGTGLSGDIYGKRGTITRLEIGPYVLHDVPTDFPPAEVRSKQKGSDAILGNNAIRRFNVIFDYSRSTLYLKPNSHNDHPFE